MAVSFLTFELFEKTSGSRKTAAWKDTTAGCATYPRVIDNMEYENNHHDTLLQLGGGGQKPSA